MFKRIVAGGTSVLTGWEARETGAAGWGAATAAGRRGSAAVAAVSAVVAA